MNKVPVGRMPAVPKFRSVHIWYETFFFSAKWYSSKPESFVLPEQPLCSCHNDTTQEPDIFVIWSQSRTRHSEKVNYNYTIWPLLEKVSFTSPLLQIFKTADISIGLKTGLLYCPLRIKICQLWTIYLPILANQPPRDLVRDLFGRTLLETKAAIRKGRVKY